MSGPMYFHDPTIVITNPTKTIEMKKQILHSMKETLRVKPVEFSYNRESAGTDYNTVIWEGIRRMFNNYY